MSNDSKKVQPMSGLSAIMDGPHPPSNFHTFILTSFSIHVLHVHIKLCICDISKTNQQSRDVKMFLHNTKNNWKIICESPSQRSPANFFWCTFKFIMNKHKLSKSCIIRFFFFKGVAMCIRINLQLQNTLLLKQITRFFSWSN